MTTLRLLADDLTGALDTAAAFVGLAGVVPVFWPGALPAAPPAIAAYDCATREIGRVEAGLRHADAAAFLMTADIAFKKIDSLLRGHAVAEIAALMQSGVWTHAVLAPAFPYQGRITRNGRQYRSDGSNGWLAVGGDLVPAFLAEGLPARRHDLSAPGVAVMDAETDEALDDIVRTGLRCSPGALWCGSAGLAEALVRVLAPGAMRVPAPVHLPILGVFGSDQGVTAEQLDRCGDVTLHVGSNVAASAAEAKAHIARGSAAIARFDLPAGLARADAAALIRERIRALLPLLSPPGTLVVAGGETLRDICDLLGASHLQVTGALQPGVPRSKLRGGIWDGVDVISKSGAFGQPNWLRHLLLAAGIALKRNGT